MKKLVLVACCLLLFSFFLPAQQARVTLVTKIAKGSGDATSHLMEVVEMDEIDFGSYSFEELRREPIKMEIRDMDTQKNLDPNKFDIEVKVENGFLYEDPHLRVDGIVIYLDLRPRGEWCECLFPENLNIKVVSTPKADAVFDNGGHYNQTINPIHINVVKSRVWLSRCFWVLVTILGLLLLAIYLRALLKKNRFKKYAMINSSYTRLAGGRNVNTPQGGHLLRKPGFGAWLNRWLNPFTDEQITLNWQKPKTGSMTFVASDSPEVVNLTRESFNVNTMNMPGYRPNPASNEKLIPMTGVVTVYSDRNKVKEEGRLAFDAGSGNDLGGFRLFMGILLTAALVIIGALLFFMIKAAI